MLERGALNFQSCAKKKAYTSEASTFLTSLWFLPKFASENGACCLAIGQGSGGNHLRLAVVEVLTDFNQTVGWEARKKNRLTGFAGSAESALESGWCLVGPHGLEPWTKGL